MPRLPFRIALFLSSYAPLFALLAFINRKSTVALFILVGVSLMSLGALAVVMLAKRSEQGTVAARRTARPKDGDVLGVRGDLPRPVPGRRPQRPDGVVVFAGLPVVVLGIVYINSNMLFVNPVLSLCGYHMLTSPTPTITSTRSSRGARPRSGIEIRPAQVGRYVRLEVRRSSARCVDDPHRLRRPRPAARGRHGRTGARRQRTSRGAGARRWPATPRVLP